MKIFFDLTDKKWIYHLIFWMGYLSLLVSIADSFDLIGYSYIGIILVNLSIAILIFYGNSYLLFPKFFTKRKIWLFITIQIILFLSISYIRYALVAMLMVMGIASKYDNSMPVSRGAAAGIYYQFTFWAFAYFFYKETQKKQRRIKEIEVQNKRLKEEKLLSEQQKQRAEYSFLRAQINPHFLYNTLSYLYSRSINGDSKGLSDAILTLSEIMRYALEIRDINTDEVPLEDEIEHIQNMIKLNRMRFADSFYLIFDIKGDTKGVRVIPLILMTLVENVFKHGELTNPGHPVKISLEVAGDKSSFIFTTRNKKKRGPVELSYGIGMENTRQRLEMAYGENYSLDLSTIDGYYIATLKIKLMNKSLETETGYYSPVSGT